MVQATLLHRRATILSWEVDGFTASARPQDRDCPAGTLEKEFCMGKVKPTVGEILTSLKHEVVFGKAYLGIAKGLGEADSVVLGTAGTFFGLTVEACLHMAQMFAAKLYDETRGAVTVKSLLKAAQSQAGTFKHGTAQEVSTAIKEAETRVAGLVAILKPVKDRRNQSLAHLDPRTVIDPAGLAQRAKLTFADLGKVFDESGAILNEFSRLWEDMTTVMTLVDGTDYTGALSRIAEAKHIEADKYEAEFKEIAPFPRPKTSRNPW